MYAVYLVGFLNSLSRYYTLAAIVYRDYVISSCGILIVKSSLAVILRECGLYHSAEGHVPKSM